jgi:hypothetical protein
MRQVAFGTVAAGLAVLAIVAAGSWVFFASMQHTRFTSSAPVSSLAAGTITVDDAAEQVTISSADLGTSLYQLTIDYVYSAPDFSDAGARLQVNRASNIANFWGRPRDVIDLKVNSSVAWSVVINGAGSTINLDFGNGGLRSLTTNGAGSTVALSAGPPHGVVSVTMSGLGNRLRMQLPPSTQYRATADGIGASVEGSSETDGWSAAQDRYEVTVNGVGINAIVTNGEAHP